MSAKSEVCGVALSRDVSAALAPSPDKFRLSDHYGDIHLIQDIDLARQTNKQPADQFLLVEEAARSLGLSAADLRQGISRGLIPIRHDNKGAIRIHCIEVPDDFLDQIHTTDIVPQLQAETYADELFGLREQVLESNVYNTQLEGLLKQQSAAIERSATLLEATESRSTALVLEMADLKRDLAISQAESINFADILERTFSAIDQREQQFSSEIGQLSGAADRAMRLLNRAISDGEKAKTETDRLDILMDKVVNGSARLEREIDQRNAVIDNQHGLMERLVSLSEQSINQKPVQPARKKSFWQRLWGGKRGI